MADDLTTQSATLATIPASSVIATDDVAGKHYQKMKLFDGTADSATAIAVAGGVEANALRVTIASDSTGVVSVDDNGGSLTVDAPVGTPVNVQIGDGVTTAYMTGQGALATSISGPIDGFEAEVVDANGGGALKVAPWLWRNATLDYSAAALADGDAIGTANGVTAAGAMAYNGTTWDRLRGDIGNGLDVDVTRSALPTGAATAVLQTQPGVDIGDVTVNNGAGAAAVNIQDGGNAITVDGTVTAAQATAASLNATVVGTGTFAVQATGTVTANAGTNLNTSALALEAGGNLAGAATSLALIDDIVYTDDTSTHATGTSKGALLMAAAVPTDAAVNANDIGAVAMTTDRKLHVSVQDALPAGTNNIGDVDVLTLPALVAGTANIGDVDVLTIAAGDNNIGNVDIVTMPAITGAVTVSSGSITADTELPTAAAISAENTAAPTAPSIYNFPLLFDGTNWDRAKGDSTDGALVNLGGNNDVTVTSGTVIATQATATNLKVDASGVAVPVTDNSGSLTVDAPVGTPAFVRLSDGAAAITTLPVSLASVPSHAVTIDAGAVTSLALIDDPVFADEAAFTVASSKVMASGILAVSSSAQPDSTATGTAVIPIANRNRVPFVIGGDPGVITLKHTTITTAVTDAAIVTIAGSLKIVVTRITVTLDNASTVFPTLLVGFGTANTPTTTGVLIAHGGVPAGGGMNVGDGSGIIGVGGDGEDLRVTTTGNATGNGLQITVSYYLIVA